MTPRQVPFHFPAWLDLGTALFLVAGLGSGVIGLIVGAIARSPGKGFLIGAIGGPVVLLMASRYQ